MTQVGVLFRTDSGPRAGLGHLQRCLSLARALGDGRKRMHPVETELHRFARRFIFTTQPIQKGERIASGNAAILRKGRDPAGLPAHRWEEVLGKCARHFLKTEKPISKSDIA